MAALKTTIQETLCGSQQVIFGNANLYMYYIYAYIIYTYIHAYMFVIPIREKKRPGIGRRVERSGYTRRFERQKGKGEILQS